MLSLGDECGLPPWSGSEASRHVSMDRTFQKLSRAVCAWLPSMPTGKPQGLPALS